MNALNYFQHAMRDMKTFAQNDRLGDEWKADRAMAHILCGLIEHGMKFDLPEKGRIFDDELRGIKGEKVRLPAPIVCIEYHTPNDDNSPAEYYAPKRVVVAVEATQGDDDSDVEILIISLCTRGNLDFFLPCPVQARVNSSWEQKTTGTIVFPHAASRVSYEMGRDAFSEFGKDIGEEARVVLELCEALSCSNVSTEIIQRADPAVNAKRARKGKLPLYETRVLVIDTPHEVKPKTGAGLGTHASPRQHLRRGHIRRIAPIVEGESHRKIWVNSCVVGSSDNGIISKKYNVRKALL